ncbi:hypothetical protein GYMLUDRAFT_123991, partial [Collybiopsis luxurians FD-317 M1]
ILLIQDTSVPSECVFSSAGETDTECCNCLSPKMMQALQVLKFGMRSSVGLTFTAGLSHEEELQYLETLTDDCFAVP